MNAARGAGGTLGGRRFSVIAAVHPLVTGAAHFNGAMIAALRSRGAVEVLSWRRMYPRLLFRGELRDEVSRRPPEAADFVLDWQDPRTWRAALRRIVEFAPDAVILPWLHPVMAPPYRWLLRRIPRATARVVVCHNVLPHERFPGAGWLTRATLRHADVLVTHASDADGELDALGLAPIRRVHGFHPRFAAADLAAPPAAEDVEAERERQGAPRLSLLTFGAIRPYKGVDVALEALARVDPALDVHLVVAGRFWSSVEPYRRRVDELDLASRVDLRDGYVSNEDAAVLFSAAHAVLLPYRTATQSGVVQLAFAYGRPVIATRVGGLPEAVRDGTDGILCPPGDAVALAGAIEQIAREHGRLAANVEREGRAHSFQRYADIIDDALRERAA